MLTYFRQSLKKSLLTLFLALPLSHFVFGGDLQLPNLGGDSGGLITPSQEYDLGQKWLRIYRAQVPTTSDPFILSYSEQLVRRLARYSDLNDRRLDVLVIENPTLNAFAIPGGVIGIHTGLFRYAQTEEQFSSVVAHELAHLSQRHYARQVEQQKNMAIPTLAGMLAAILIGVTAGADAGIAAVAATNASAAGAQLRFSRQMEQEADRRGMETLVRADMNPYAMSEMFEQMLRATRFQRRPPEFLMSHPVTESRVADSRARAQEFPRRLTPNVLEYELVRARTIIRQERNNKTAIQLFEDELKGTEYSDAAAQYGLVLALIRDNQTDRARQLIDQLRASSPDNLYFVVAEADILTAEKKYPDAIALLQRYRQKYPNHHPLNTRLAEILMLSGDYKLCEEVLNEHVLRRPKDDYVWYLLAEAEGLAGNIFAVHMARAEYFKLNALFDKAEIQLSNALKLVASDDQHTRAKIQQELKEVRQLRKEIQL
ncbi:M48 family metalloprotease [Teredinibacter waterburyi]|uniref:M48 family metalloprotease n=1 Tax=Teredinibacter waterburyi TaxID=1500538 RepID=UPI00165FE22B|nr:M48 family metalloprotease [Teredinibacter waterburyi]